MGISTDQRAEAVEGDRNVAIIGLVRPQSTGGEVVVVYNVIISLASKQAECQGHNLRKRKFSHSFEDFLCGIKRYRYTMRLPDAAKRLTWYLSAVSILHHKFAFPPQRTPKFAKLQ